MCVCVCDQLLCEGGTAVVLLALSATNALSKVSMTNLTGNQHSYQLCAYLTGLETWSLSSLVKEIYSIDSK